MKQMCVTGSLGCRALLYGTRIKSEDSLPLLLRVLEDLDCIKREDQIWDLFNVWESVVSLARSAERWGGGVGFNVVSKVCASS